jgi:hypothetical protein
LWFLTKTEYYKTHLLDFCKRLFLSTSSLKVSSSVNIISKYYFDAKKRTKDLWSSSNFGSIACVCRKYRKIILFVIFPKLVIAITKIYDFSFKKIIFKHGKLSYQFLPVNLYNSSKWTSFSLQFFFFRFEVSRLIQIEIRCSSVVII